jgi:hypothetical protein
MHGCVRGASRHNVRSLEKGAHGFPGPVNPITASGWGVHGPVRDGALSRTPVRLHVILMPPLSATTVVRRGGPRCCPGFRPCDGLGWHRDHSARRRRLQLPASGPRHRPRSSTRARSVTLPVPMLRINRPQIPLVRTGAKHWANERCDVDARGEARVLTAESWSGCGEGSHPGGGLYVWHALRRSVPDPLASLEPLWKSSLECSVCCR